MQIGGFQKVSFIDFPQHLAAVVFTQGCNWRCPYCHNPALVLPERFGERLSPESILETLRKRSGMLDGVVISGGEPTLHTDLGDFIAEIRALGYAVKLDTNGTLPERLENLLERDLLDYIAMDVKACPRDYARVCGRTVNMAVLEKSIALIRQCGVDYELRTTLVPELHPVAAMRDILPLVRGCKRYVLQPFIAENATDPALSESKDYSPAERTALHALFENEVEELIIRDPATANIAAQQREN